MKQSLIYIALLVTGVSQAQQNITGTSPIGFSAIINIATAATASTVPINITGTNVTWNCSNLQTSSPAVTLNINSPSGKPFSGDYPSANRNMDVTVSGTLLANEFGIANSDSLVKLGGHVAGSSYEIYDNPQLDMKFPFAYNDVTTDNYSKTSYNANGSVSSTQTGSITLSYEGYGTLVLPAGTYTNVAMLKRIRTNSIGPTTTSYSWVKYPSGDKLMEYDDNGGIKVNYVTSISTGLIPQVKNDEFAVYPTITDKTIFIKGLKDLDTIKIYNQLGQIVSFTQNHDHSIDLDGTRGIYFIEIISPSQNGKSLHKIVLN